MKLFTSDGCSYEGMSQEVITALRTELGKTTVFVTEEEYNQFMAALPPPGGQA